MATEDTIIQSKNLDGKNVKVGNEKKEAWKKIGLGSATGILVGAGAIYATAAQAAEQPQPEQPAEPTAPAEPELKVAEVEPGQSFEDAFAEARAEVGPGGVFHWNGGVYGTYYEDEWNAMTEEERQEWAESVKPEYGVDNIDTQRMTAENPRPHVVHHTAEPDVNVHIDNMEVHVHDDEAVVVGATDEDDIAVVDEDGEVHVITVGDETVYDVDGQPVTVTDYVVDGYVAAAADVDGDGLPDLVAVDVNDNGILDDGEAMDMETGELLTANGDPIDDIVIA